MESSIRMMEVEAEPLFGSTVLVSVNKPPTKFFVHEQLLRENSDFFKAALTGNWKEKKQRTVELPDDSVEGFKIFLGWLYRRKICTQQREYNTSELNKLSRAYVLGEKLQSAAFKDSVVNALIAFIGTKNPTDGCRMFPGLSDIDIIYCGTPSKSPMRRLYVDMYYQFANKGWIAEPKAEGPKDLKNLDFSKDLNVKFMENRGKPLGKEPWLEVGGACKYHEHAADKPCSQKF